MNSPSKIIHLSDTHLYENEGELFYGKNPFRALKEVVEFIRKEDPEVDLVVVTGDLSEDRKYTSYVLVDSLLKKLGKACCWLPGNHDDFSVLPPAIRKKYVKNEWRLGAWKFIALDTTVKGEDFGTLAEAELQRLDVFLSENSEQPVAVCMHHPPVDVGSEFLDSIGLTNKEAFWDRLAAHNNVKAVLCGHIHQELRIVKNGVVVSSPPSTCVQWLPKSKDFKFDDRSGGYNLVTLRHDGSSTIQTVRSHSATRLKFQT
ncbi:MAG: phosphodiesterase [Cytophagales bacterium]|nr:phosphodiesterase [Cytophagales bacterium]